MTTNSPNTTINTTGNQSTAPNSGKQSAVFRDFIKHVQKTGKNTTKKHPDYREVLKTPEYRNYDIRKALNVEIREWIVPLGNSEEKGVRMLLFVVPKNQTDRKVQDINSIEKDQKANL